MKDEIVRKYLFKFRINFRPINFRKRIFGMTGLGGTEIWKDQSWLNRPAEGTTESEAASRTRDSKFLEIEVRCIKQIPLLTERFSIRGCLG